MGLAVSVGILADLRVNDEDGFEIYRKSFKRLNKVLKANDLPAHDEPEELPDLDNRAGLVSYPYSFLHHLRRFAAHASTKPNWKPKPFPASADPAEDPLVIDESAMLSSHLLCHSDCEGFYVPIDFPEPIFAVENEIPGGMLGSTHGLMRELIAVAPYLSISLSGDELLDSEARRINESVEAEGPFWIEKAVWLSLYEAARLSIEYRTVICFT